MRPDLPRLSRSLLAVLLGALALTAPVAGPAHAAQCAEPSAAVPDAVSAADAVATVKVLRRLHAGGARASYRVRVVTSFKGKATGRIVVTPQPSSCDLADLTAGSTYLLFLRQRSQDWFVPADLPSSADVAGLQPQVETALAPPKVTFGRPQAGAPASLRRVAAPGAALVIIGLLGLLFVRRSPRSHA